LRPRAATTSSGCGSCASGTSRTTSCSPRASANASDESKILIKIDPAYFRPTEVDLLVGDYSKAKRLLGWEPKITFKALVDDMMKADIEEHRRELLLINSK
jgi:GDP-D-mannose dehydratase